MQKNKFFERLKIYAVKGKNIFIKYAPVLKKKTQAVLIYARQSWKSIAVLLPVLLFVYYVLGGWVTNNIDRSLPDISHSENGLSVVSTTADLIKREVDDNMWTPNLPLFFPGSILDNMPNYQKGIVYSLRNVVKAWEAVQTSDDLRRAAELLNYPPNVWLLSKTQNLTLAPSSGAQYRKARKALLQFNRNLQLTESERTALFLTSLKRIRKGMAGLTASLEKQVREESSNWMDFKADDAFYYNQGRLYGYYVVLKALSVDFKTEILDDDAYVKWSSMLKTMEDGINFDPLIIRNGEPHSSLAPNHLLALNYYITKTSYQLSRIIDQLSKE